MKIAGISPPVPGIPPNEQLNVKIEIDPDPPAGAGFETRYRLSPIPYSVRLYDLPSLFAGKIYALLCRGWKQRVKGRDFSDYIWYLSRDVRLNIIHLEARMRQTGQWSGVESLDRETLIGLREKRFAAVDFEQAKADATPFLKDTRSLDLWSANFFTAITKESLKIVQGAKMARP